MHTTETDGKDDIAAMAEAAREAGLEYIAITDHSQSLAMANGLDERRAIDHAKRIRQADKTAGVRLLAGIECDIKPDGSLDLADDCLAALDLVVASVHSAFNQDRQQMTDRLLRAIENPHVDILGHPTGRMILKREPYPFDIDAIVDAAARHGVALEINCQVHRLDLNDVHARLARDRGVPIVISSDAHSRAGLGDAPVGSHGSPPRLARAGGRAEHAPVRRVHRQGCGATGGGRDAAEDAHAGRQAGRDQASVLRDDEADDSAGSRAGAAAPQVDERRGGARARRGLHGRAVADAVRLGTTAEK